MNCRGLSVVPPVQEGGDVAENRDDEVARSRLSRAMTSGDTMER